MSAPVPVTLPELHPHLQERLQPLIAALGHPVLLSCNRHRGCEAEHRRGVDVKCTTAAERFHLVGLAIRFGVRRIGLYPGLIHLDVDKRPTPAIWVGRPLAQEE